LPQRDGNTDGPYAFTRKQNDVAATVFSAVDGLIAIFVGDAFGLPPNNITIELIAPKVLAATQTISIPTTVPEVFVSTADVRKGYGMRYVLNPVEDKSDLTLVAVDASEEEAYPITEKTGGDFIYGALDATHTGVIALVRNGASGSPAAYAGKIDANIGASACGVPVQTLSICKGVTNAPIKGDPNGAQGFDVFVEAILYAILGSLPPQCSSIYGTSYCTSTYPACDANGAELPVCRSFCNQIVAGANGCADAITNVSFGDKVKSTISCPRPPIVVPAGYCDGPQWGDAGSCTVVLGAATRAESVTGVIAAAAFLLVARLFAMA